MPRCTAHRLRWPLRAPLLLVALMGLDQARPALSPFGDSVPLATDVLDAMRGGFVAPDGTQFSVGVAMETSVNGVLVLRTTMTAQDTAGVLPMPTVTVGTQVIPAVAVQTPAGAGAGVLLQSGSSAIRVAVAEPGTTLVSAPTTVQSGQAVALSGIGPTPVADGGAVVALSPGASQATELGTVQALQQGRDIAVQFDGDGLQVRHQFGDLTGQVVGNVVSDRTIDQATIISVQVMSSGLPPMGSLLPLNDALRAVAIRPLP